MKPTVTISRGAVIAAAAALAVIPGAASASTTWCVAHPLYTAVDNVPYAPLNAITAISAAC